MSEPERWLTSPDAPGAMREMLSAAQKVGPSALERAALAGKIGVATSGLWIVPALKGLAGAALVAGGVWMATTAGDPAAPKESKHLPPATDSTATSRGSSPSMAPESPPELVPPVVETPSEAQADDERTPKSQVKGREAVARAPKPTEIALISGARNSLESAPQKALSLLSEHAKIYPTGVLAEEREVLRIRALKNSGRAKDAEAQQQRFHQEHPESVHHVP